MMSRLPSVEPSSTTMTSVSGPVCASALSIASVTRCAALKQGTRIETSGLILLIHVRWRDGIEAGCDFGPTGKPLRVLQALDQLGDVPSELGGKPARALVADGIGHFRRTEAKIHRLVRADEHPRRPARHRI